VSLSRVCKRQCLSGSQVGAEKLSEGPPLACRSPPAGHSLASATILGHIMRPNLPTGSMSFNCSSPGGLSCSPPELTQCHWFILIPDGAFGTRRLMIVGMPLTGNGRFLPLSRMEQPQAASHCIQRLGEIRGEFPRKAVNIPEKHPERRIFRAFRPAASGFSTHLASRLSLTPFASVSVSLSVWLAR